MRERSGPQRMHPRGGRLAACGHAPCGRPCPHSGRQRWGAPGASVPGPGAVVPRRDASSDIGARLL